MADAPLIAHRSLLWDDLVTTAILGVERRPFAPPAAVGELGELLAGLDQSDQAGALLGAAAAVALHRRAGRLPSHIAPPEAAPAPADDLPVCSRHAAARLATMLKGTHRALLPEWLAALARAGRRVPPALLPDLLELGRAQAALRPAILPAIGARGGWLAAQNPDWSYANSEFSVLSFKLRAEELKTQNSKLKIVWETGDRAARLALLRATRAVDPAHGRELLAVTWAGERADDRVAFLEALDAGLSMDDEPFLEAALDDRGKEVRRTAARLLGRLPHSQLVRRMVERLRPLLAWSPPVEGRLLGLRPGQPARIDVTLPDMCDRAMARDGVEPKPPAGRQDLGERAWWLLQMLGAVPPSVWSEQWRTTPAALVAAARASEWGAVLRDGWAAAARAFGAAEWAGALVRADPERADLLDALPTQDQEALLLDMLRSDVVPLHQHPILELLRRTRHTWSAELTRAVFRAVRAHMRAWRNTYDYQLRGALLEDFVLRVSPAMLDEIAAGWPEDPEVLARWEGVIDRLLIVLQFRRDMLQELAPAMSDEQ
jgi:hypothetical protein